MCPRTTFQSWGNSSSFVRQQEGADTGQPLVVPRGQGRPRRIAMHLAELQHLEFLAAEADAATSVQNRPGALELDRDGKRQHQRRKEDQQYCRDHDVTRALGERGNRDLGRIVP